MFTGIVEATGRIEAIEDRDTTRSFRIRTPLGAELSPGDSVAVDGGCLTAVTVDDQGFTVDVIGTTLAKTIAGGYSEGAVVNLERAMVFGGRVDGHLVQGHVDGTGRLLEVRRDGEFWLMDFALPASVYDLTITHGSITLNGVSLTVAELLPDIGCRVGIIPFTFEHTNLGALEPEAPVNVEGDLLGKYVARILTTKEARTASHDPSGESS